MKCPCCKLDIEIRDVAYYNVEAYRDPVRVTTNCCGNIVVLRSHISFSVSEYLGSETEDSWGVPKNWK